MNLTIHDSIYATYNELDCLKWRQKHIPTAKINTIMTITTTVVLMTIPAIAPADNDVSSLMITTVAIISVALVVAVVAVVVAVVIVITVVVVVVAITVVSICMTSNKSKYSFNTSSSGRFNS